MEEIVPLWLLAVGCLGLPVIVFGIFWLLYQMNTWTNEPFTKYRRSSHQELIQGGETEDKDNHSGFLVWMRYIVWPNLKKGLIALGPVIVGFFMILCLLIGMLFKLAAKQ